MTTHKDREVPASRKGLGMARARPILAVLALGITLSVVVSQALLGLERGTVRQDFANAAQDRAADVRSAIEPNLLMLRSMAVLYSRGDPPTRQEFEKAFHPLPAECPGIQSVVWVPRVRAGEREAYEAAARRDGLTGFLIREFAAEDRLEPAGLRDEYFPAFYIEPMKNALSVIGLDVASESVRREALQRARDTGEQTMTAPVRLIKDSDLPWGFIVFQPVYKPGAPTATLEDRRANLVGFVAEVFWAAQWVEGAIAGTPSAGLDLWLYDMPSAARASLLYFHPSRSRGEKTPPMSGDSEPVSEHSYAQVFDVAGRQWQIVVRPAPQWLEAHTIWQGWTALAVGLTFTGLAALILGTSRRRTERIQWLAGQVREANVQLADLARVSAENPLPILSVAGDGTLLFANAASDSLLADWESGVGKPVPPWVRHTTARALGAGRRDEVEAEHRGRTFSFLIVPLAEPGYVNWYARDITENKRAEAVVQNQLRFLETLLETMPNPTFYKDKAGRYLGCNKAFEESLGLPREAIIGKTVRDMMPEELARGHEEMDAALLRNPGRQVYERQSLHKGSDRRYEMCFKATYMDSEGRVAGIVCAIVDITDRKATEEALRTQGQLLQNILSHTPHFVFWKDRDSVYQGCNENFAHVVGVDGPGAIAGKTDFDLPWTREETDHFLVCDRQVVDSGQPMLQFQETMHQADGAVATVLTSKVPLCDAQGEVIGLIGMYADITALKRAEEALQTANSRLEAQAGTDGLTGLTNRRRFMEMADREFQRFLRQGAPLAMAMLDVDHFKAINDTYGHAAGDRALVALARFLSGEIRATDVLARYGGEEFMILMPDTSAEEAVAAVERMRRRLEGQTLQENGCTIAMTVSIGVTAARTEGMGSFEELIRQADEAMYAAKAAGRNCSRTWAEAAVQSPAR